MLKSTKLNSKSETNKIKSVPFTNMDAALFTNSMDTVLGSLAVKKWGKLEQKNQIIHRNNCRKIETKRKQIKQQYTYIILF